MGIVNIDPCFLILVLVGGEWLNSRPGRFNAEELALSTHPVGGCVCSRSGLKAVEKWTFLTLPGQEPQLFGSPANSQLKQIYFNEWTIKMDNTGIF
jgi:hypothetical protein